MSGLRTVEEHLTDILGAVTVLPAERLPVWDADGRVLREPVRAAVDIPVFDNSGMDGFAVRFADAAAAAVDAPVALRVVADLPAGTADDPTLGPGEAARIMTGSPVPTDADTIVPFENTVGGLADSLASVQITVAPARTGVHVRRAGEDARAGDVILPAGVLLGALQLSAAAAAGVAEVVVSARPRVAVISTGSELVVPGTPLRRGQIPESNSVLLAGLARAAGAQIVRRTSVDDEGGDLRALLAEITDPASPDRADVVIFSGGVSAGAYEVVKTELADAMTFVKVAMQPGKPQGFGRLGADPATNKTLLFGLPGNPVSSAVSFETFVRPALLAMQARDAIARPVLRLPVTESWRTPAERRQYVPAVIDRSDPARWTVRPATAGGSGSHLAGGLGLAEAYAIVAAEVSSVAVGDLVDVMLMS